MRGQLAAAVRRALGSTWTWAAAVAALSWPDAPIVAEAGGDPSAYVALHLATERGLDFGRDVVWTYGPLGFLHHPRFVTGPLFALDFVYTAGVRLALAGLLVRALRRTFPVAVAALIAWPVAAACAAGLRSALGAEPEVAVVAIWGLEALRAEPGSWLRRSYPLAAGAVTGLLLLVKLNVGLASLLAGAVAVWATRRDGRWRLPAYATSAVVATAFLLAVTRQGAPLDYVRTGLSISAGYSSAMGEEQPGLGWQYWTALAAALILVAATLSETRLAPRAPRGAMLVLLGLVGFLTFKEGFVRHDTHHADTFFPIVLAVGATFTWQRRRAQPLLLSLAALGGFTLAAYGVGLGDLMRPRARLTALADSAHVVASRGERIAIATRGQRGIAARDPISSTLLATVGRATVAVEPEETAFAWAYHLNWRPLPVLQLFSAYTRTLDDADRDLVASSRAPRFILYENGRGIDGRNGQWESPAAMLEILCRYRGVRVDGGWALLERASDRCGRTRPLATVTARSGRPVRVPAPVTARSLVAVRVHGVEVAGLEHVRAFVHRALQRAVVLDGGRRFRLVPGTAGDGLLLSAPAAVDFPPPANLSPQASTIAAEVVGGAPRQVRYEFVEVPLRPAR